MPKSRHRAPSACLRHWVVWAAAAVVVAAACAFFSPLGGGPASVAWTFLLLLLCFAAGSVANSMFLARPSRQAGHLVLPAVREPMAVEAAPGVPEASRARPAGDRPRPARTGPELAAFASPRDIGGNVEVAVLISGNVRPDPAGTEALGVGRAALSGVDVVEGIPLQQTGVAPSEVEFETAPREVESGPYPGSVHPMSNGRSPDSRYRVKGNTRSKRYHTVQSPYYERTKAGVWFRSTADAERAGFSAWNSRVKAAS
ncbi:hypothetical protein [Saccharopolyspora griseoalba]|uniref:Uncharacterized protein n=1 Tax=Saccharopolyspora griseoalba TaxID=1431848 RepID=A0ABW2LN57_9PSEU